MGELSPTHWLIVILVAVVLFGARRLPDAARSLGRSARILKSEISGIQDDAKPAAPAADKSGDGSAAEATPADPQVAPATPQVAQVAKAAAEGVPATPQVAPTSSDQSAASAGQPEAATPDTAARP
jgi:sec-independent protein translocase protein TatA